MIIDDVPSPIDLRLMLDAQEWEQSAMLKRPWRVDFFSCFLKQIEQSPMTILRTLELGSGPGFLAKHVLESTRDFSYVMLDFSLAMHQLAKARLGELVTRAVFIEQSFKDPTWTSGLGKFECVLTNQAVHELRHKRYAPELHAQVKSVLAPGGFYLVCDHFAGEGGMANDQLYMSIDEQREALLAGGFNQVDQLLIKGGLVMHRASNSF
jgi:SAM-dependent methyltransferase